MWQIAHHWLLSNSGAVTARPKDQNTNCSVKLVLGYIYLQVHVTKYQCLNIGKIDQLKNNWRCLKTFPISLITILFFTILKLKVYSDIKRCIFAPNFILGLHADRSFGSIIWSELLVMLLYVKERFAFCSFKMLYGNYLLNNKTQILNIYWMTSIYWKSFSYIDFIFAFITN